MQFNFAISKESTIHDRFVKFHNAHPQVYEMFVAFAKQLVKKKRAARGEEHIKLGAKMIMERIRWELATGSHDDMGFKINNDFVAHYARLFMKDHKEYNGCFETRGIRTP